MTKHLKANISRLLDTPRGDEWRDWSACRGEDPELFFIDGAPDTWEHPRHDLQRETAKAFCEWCVASPDCLANALAKKTRDNDGIRGGMTPTERRELETKMRRARSRKSRAKVAG